MNVVPAVWIPYPRPSASVELRCGVLYRGCQCVKRDGLQQDCPRSECQGRAACLDYPAPTCVPSGNALRPYKSPSELQQERNTVHTTKHYINYKRKLDEKYRSLSKKGYIENPPVQSMDNNPCKVHKNNNIS